MKRTALFFHERGGFLLGGLWYFLPITLEEVTMSTAQPTLDDVWRLFQETDRKFQETDRKFQETDRKFQDTERLLKESSQETDRKFQETDRKFQETERLLKEGAEATRLEIKALSKNLGEIGNRLGECVEHLVMPTVVRLFQAQGLEVHEVHSDIKAKREGQGIQVDVLVVNDGVLIAIECKSKMTTAQVDEHIQRMNKLKQMLPAYRHHQAFGAVAALVMPDDVAEYAEEQGFYVLVQSGETLTIRNEPEFRAKAW